MKKIFTLLLCAVGVSSMSHAQIKIEDAHNVGPDVNNTTITVTDVASIFEFVTDFHVINEGSSTVELKVRTTELDVCSGTESATCWVLCPAYNTAGASPITSSTFNETIAAGDTATSFAAHYKPMGLDCCSMFKYEWLDVNDNNNVVATVIVRYDHTSASSCTVDVTEMELNAEINMMPNPANEEVNIQLRGLESANQVMVEMHDLLGKKIERRVVSNTTNMVNVNTSDYNNGVYFVSVIADGQVVKTSKLVVRH